MIRKDKHLVILFDQYAANSLITMTIILNSKSLLRQTLKTCKESEWEQPLSTSYGLRKQCSSVDISVMSDVIHNLRVSEMTS